MSFLFPLGWLFAALLPVVVALYLRRVRRRQVVVPTLIFWQRALGEQSHRAFLGRLRQWLSLLLHLIIFALILLALVRPEPAGFSSHGHSTVIILDSRARMQAIEPNGESRFAKAIALAKQTAANARDGASVAILTAQAQPEVVSPFSSEPSQLMERLSALHPTDASGDLSGAITLARELLAARPGTHRLLLLTDGSDRKVLESQTPPSSSPDNPSDTAPSTPSPPSAPLPVEIVSVGTPLDNVAITRFAARPQFASPQTSDLLLTVANYGTEPAEGNVEITSDGALLDVKPFILAPSEKKTEVFPAIASAKKSALPGTEAPGKLIARLDLKKRDALALDDTAYATLPAMKPLHVLLVSKGNWFLEKVLPADPNVRYELLEPSAFTPSMAANFDAVIFDGDAPDLESLSSGNTLFLKQSPLGSSGTLKEPLVTDTDPSSPLLRHVEWRSVTFLRAADLPPPIRDGWRFQIPLRSFDHPLIITGEQGPRRLAIFAFDVAETDLPLRVAFPLLISNTLQWLAGGGEGSAAGDMECGSALALATGETVSKADDSTEKIAQFFQPQRNGFYQLTSGDATRPLAVNTFSPREADLRSELSAAPQGAQGVFSAANGLLAGAGSRPLWQWLTLAALGLFALEWALYHRRHTE